MKVLLIMAYSFCGAFLLLLGACLGVLIRNAVVYRRFAAALPTDPAQRKAQIGKRFVLPVKLALAAAMGAVMSAIAAFVMQTL